MKRFFDLKDLGVAFSLAVLWFTNVWREFIYSKSYNFYFDFEPLLEYSAMIINVALVTFLFLLLVKLFQSVTKVWLKSLLQITFLALALSAFCGLGSEIMKVVLPGNTFFVNPLLPTIVFCICVLFSFKQKFRLDAILSNLKVISLLLLPFGLLTCVQLLWIWSNTALQHISASRAAAERVVTENQTSPLAKKVVWIIFDGADYEAITDAVKQNTALPEIERLMSESFVAENAFSPNFGTQESLPALLTGKTLKRATPVAFNDIMLYPADGSSAFSLRESDNLIAQLNSSGLKIGIAGWTHPYPRIFNDKISAGYWHSLQHAQCYSLLDCSGYIYRISLQTVPFMTRIFPSLWFNENVNQIERHKFLTTKANELISRPDYNFLFFHFSIPHGPFIDRQNSITDNYFYALEAVDETIKRLRETLENTEQWNDTVLIISSDHYGRGKTGLDFFQEQRAGSTVDTRIPFIVKFPEEKIRFDYKAPFNTVITKEVILSVFNGEIKDSRELGLRLDNLSETKPELINFRPDTTDVPNYEPWIKGN